MEGTIPWQQSLRIIESPEGGATSLERGEEFQVEVGAL